MLEYFSKSQEYDGAAKAFATKVTLVNNEGANVPVFLPPDAIDLSNSELYELAMDKHYQDNFPQRAEKEKFAEHEHVLAEHRAEISRLKEEALAEVRAETEKNREMVKTVTMILNQVLMQVSIDDEEEVEDAESEPTETTN